MRRAAALLAVFAAYVATAELGFALAMVGGNVSPVWIPSGLGVAALLLAGRRMVPVLWLGAFVATAGTGAPVLSAAGVATANVLEYVAAWLVLRRIMDAPDRPFERVVEVLALLATAVAAPAVSAVGGTLALALGGVVPWPVVLPVIQTWWLADAAGIMVITPLLTAWWRGWRRHGPRRGVELAVLCALAAGATTVIFDDALWRPATDHVFAYTTFPFLIWAALRHGVRGAATAVLCISVPAVLLTAQGLGVFAGEHSIQSLLLLQAFLAATALTALLTAAALAERDKAHARAAVLSQAVEQSATTVMITDPAGRITYVNPAFTAVTGFSREEVLGANPRLLKTGHTQPEAYADLWATISAGQTWRGEFLNRRSNGGTLWELATISPVRDAGGHITHFIGTKEDITARKTAEEGMLAALQKVERSKAELERIAYAVTHTLQEPLRSIGGFTQLVERRYGARLDEEGRGYLQRVMHSAERMQGLFRDLMDYTLIDQTTEPDGPVDLAAAAGRVVADLEADRGRVALGPLPVVRGNAGQLRRLLAHLIGNALTYHRPGRPSQVAVTARREGALWRVTVADDGFGIQPEFIGRLFNLFVRLHTEQEFPGSGVGLAYCRRVAERHGGSIHLESQPGEGTCVHVWLPVSTAAGAGGSNTTGADLEGKIRR